MSNAQTFSDSLAAAVEKAAQSIVTVDARDRQTASGLVWSADGEILTADHVVQREENLNVILPDGSKHTAKLLGRDPASDLALLKIEAKGLTVPELAEAHSVRVGHLVFAVGRPDDLQADLSNVIALGGPVRGRRRRIEAYIQTGVTMYPGFSGGALVDASGRVAGLVSSGLVHGASLAIPVAEVRKVADNLRQHGSVKRGFLGVVTQPVRLAEAIATQLKQSTGLMVIDLEAGGPAEKGGLLQGDTLVSVAGSAITDIEALQAALGPETVGQAVTVKVVRGGEVKDVNLTVGARG
jgi:S1-C subfamily serine protease